MKEIEHLNRSYSELAEELEHPELPEWITLTKKVTKFRRHPIGEAIERTKGTIINEKVIRCQKFMKEKGNSVPTSFVENTNKEKLILEHVKKYSEQFSIAYKDNR